MGEFTQPRLCVYYEKDTYKIIDFFPVDFDKKIKNNLLSVWNQQIPRKILIALSEAEKCTMQQLKSAIGHSNSTLHENVKRLEDLELIQTDIIYEGNKIRMLCPVVFFVTQNPKFKKQFKRFFQGMWVDSGNSKQIVEFLDSNPDSYYTAEDLALALKIPIDDIELSLSNWDSSVTRAFSDLFREKPFEKKVLYKSKKN